MTTTNAFLEDEYILKPNETLNGLGYGDYAQRLLNHICSETPDSFNKNAGILFLRGSMRPTYFSSTSTTFPPGCTSKLDDHSVILDRTSPFSHVISPTDAICFSPLFSFFSKGQRYRGETLDDLEKVYNAARIDMRESPLMFINITSPDRKLRTIKDLRTKYWIESRDFTLSIPEKSLLATQFDTPLVPGTEYQNTVIVGYFVILRNLQIGRWRFDFGGYGTNDYVSRSIIDVEVRDSNLIHFPTDKSGGDPKDPKGMPPFPSDENN
jgi:hypothetical protein